MSILDSRRPTISSVFEQKMPEAAQPPDTVRRCFGLMCAFPSAAAKGGIWKDEELSEEILAEVAAERAEAEARAEAAAGKRREMKLEAERKRQEEKDAILKAIELESQRVDEEVKAQAEATKFSVFTDRTNSNAIQPKKK
jgi:hypothetical protein